MGFLPIFLPLSQDAPGLRLCTPRRFIGSTELGQQDPIEHKEALDYTSSSKPHNILHSHFRFQSVIFRYFELVTAGL